MTVLEAIDLRTSVRNQIGRKTPNEILVFAGTLHDSEPEHSARLQRVAGKLSQSGYLTLADVTDDEFDSIVAE